MWEWLIFIPDKTQDTTVRNARLHVKICRGQNSRFTDNRQIRSSCYEQSLCYPRIMGTLWKRNVLKGWAVLIQWLPPTPPTVLNHNVPAMFFTWHGNILCWTTMYQQCSSPDMETYCAEPHCTSNVPHLTWKHTVLNHNVPAMFFTWHGNPSSEPYCTYYLHS